MSIKVSVSPDMVNPVGRIAAINIPIGDLFVDGLGELCVRVLEGCIILGDADDGDIMVLNYEDLKLNLHEGVFANCIVIPGTVTIKVEADNE